MPQSRFNLSPASLGALAFLASLALNLLLFGPAFGDMDALTTLVDAKGYAEAGQALLLGNDPPAGLISLRGYMYPVLAVGLASLSGVVLILVQALAISIGVRCLADVELLLTGRLRLTPLTLLSVSLLVSAGVMMTEAFAFLCGAMAIRAFIDRRRISVGILCLAVGSIIKPAFLPVFAVALLALPAERKSLWMAGLVLILLGTQLHLTARFDGAARLSSAGALNFSNRFYPAVYGRVEGLGFVSYSSDEASAAREERPETADQVAYVLKHPAAALRAWSSNLWSRHLMQQSGFAKEYAGADIGHPKVAGILEDLSEALNKLFLLMAIPGLAGSLMFLRGRNWRHWPAVLIAPGILATAPLVYWQGDRIVYIPLIYLLPFAGLALRSISGGAGRI